MDHIEFTTALARLSRHKIGTKQAVALFALAEGGRASQLAKIYGCTHDVAIGRIASLRAKGLVAPGAPNPDGTFSYRPTQAGQKIIRKTLGHKKP